MFAKQYSKYYDLFNSDKAYKKEVQFVSEWAENPERILDIGCGTAHYWKYFPQGKTIWGLEKSSYMIDHSAHKHRILPVDATQASELDFFHEDFDTVTALFHVMNYIPKHDWWKDLPLKPGGYFIFDLLSKEKAEKEKFQETVKVKQGVSRKITPLSQTGNMVDLEIEVNDAGVVFKENHRMYLYGPEDIKKFCGNEFEIVEVKETKKWDVWYKLKKR